MDEIKEEKPNAGTETDFEAVIRRESEEALRRFRAVDFAGKLKPRLKAPLPKRPFVLFRRPVLFPVLGLLILAAGALAVFLFVAGNNERIRVEAGFRHMTEALSRSDVFQSDARSTEPGGPGRVPAAGGFPPFAEALILTASAPETGAENGPGAAAEGGAPLRPLFNPNERFKILYEDRVILRVLTNIANQKEV